ncbi:hypothetical protein SAMN03159495_0568 [Pseudomonas sp. NFR16]|nr:hypothetical protein SAMN03159495_0568 [Pseudomonas sp. NFR16]
MKCLALSVIYLYSNITFAHIYKLVTSPGSLWGCATVRADLFSGLKPLRQRIACFGPSKQQ